jgi:hypothetical protein
VQIQIIPTVVHGDAQKDVSVMMAMFWIIHLLIDHNHAFQWNNVVARIWMAIRTRRVNHGCQIIAPSIASVKTVNICITRRVVVKTVSVVTLPAWRLAYVNLVILEMALFV